LLGLEADRGIFVNKLKQFFGDVLISAERTYCEAERMAFRAAPEGEDKHVAAIVLKVTAQ
jgi:RNase P/RNase MRP subunit POP5